MAKEALTTSVRWEKAMADPAFVAQLMREGMGPYVQKARWFGGKDSKVKDFRAEFILPVEGDTYFAYLVVVEVLFYNSFTQSYLVPIIFVPELEDKRGVICTATVARKKGLVCDGVYVPEFREAVFRNMVNRKTFNLPQGDVTFEKGKPLTRKVLNEPVTSVLLNAEQSNTTMVFNNKFYLKFYRKLFRDSNPDYELSSFLSERTTFRNSPAFAGGISWNRPGLYEVTLALMQEKIDNQGDAWHFVLNNVWEYFERALTAGYTAEDLPKVNLYEPTPLKSLPAVYRDLIGRDTLKMYRKLAERTAGMHLALFSNRTDRHFSPDVYRNDYRVWLLNRLLYMLDNRMNSLEQNLNRLPEKAAVYARYLLANKDQAVNRILAFDDTRLNSARIRIHGDYHLGQVLVSGNDFFILDFEGEPESTIRDRKVKQPPMKDLAGLFRSFHYAIFATVLNPQHKFNASEEALTELGGRYYRAVVGYMLHHYTQTAFNGGLNIGYAAEIDFLLRYHIFEKAIYELGYELRSRPDWVIIPLKGIMQILQND